MQRHPLHPKASKVTKAKLVMLRPKLKAQDLSRVKPIRATERTRGSAWMATRVKILKRDGMICRHCAAQGRVTLAQEVDHIMELADGGTDDPGNLQALCHQCHAAKTAQAHRNRALGGG